MNNFSLSSYKNKSNWKGRGLERTNSRRYNRTDITSNVVATDNIEIEMAKNDLEKQKIYSHNENSIHKERLKISKRLIKNKSKEQQINEFKEKLDQILKEVYTYYYSGVKNKKASGEITYEITSISCVGTTVTVTAIKSAAIAENFNNSNPPVIIIKG